MKFAELLISFLIISAITFVVSSAVSFLYSLIVHSQGVFDWGSSIRFGIVLGIVITWINYTNKSKKKL